MLPSHIPTTCLPKILKDFSLLIEADCDPDTDPLMWLGGCDPEENHGYLPFECDPDEEEFELDPIKRLDSGEELAVRLHTAFVGEEMTLIDGESYLPLGDPDAEDEEGGEYDDFLREMSFYALGIKKDDDRLRIRPVEMIYCRNPGGVFHRSGISEFPKSLLRRIEQYLNALV